MAADLVADPFPVLVPAQDVPAPALVQAEELLVARGSSVIDVPYANRVKTRIPVLSGRKVRHEEVVNCLFGSSSYFYRWM